ncbi:MAG: hypothetical protein VKP62_08145 [Candidatus Sericytochromatia bacterium]|nr:hypothetical protein [Candidatus Sericytochromatia bacterium]
MAIERALVLMRPGRRPVQALLYVDGREFSVPLLPGNSLESPETEREQQALRVVQGLRENLLSLWATASEREEGLPGVRARRASRPTRGYWGFELESGGLLSVPSQWISPDLVDSNATDLLDVFLKMQAQARQVTEELGRQPTSH